MALKSWMVSLKVDVSNVSGVHAPIHAGSGGYVTDTADVSGVSGSGGMVASDTADTARESQTYQAKPNIHADCTADTAETCNKVTISEGTTFGRTTQSDTSTAKATIQAEGAVAGRQGAISGAALPRTPFQLPTLYCCWPGHTLRQEMR